MTKPMVDFHNFVNASKKKKNLQRGRTRKQESFYDREEDKRVKEGWMEGKKEGRKKGRKKGRKEGNIMQ
jgi:flagellar biosynthesis/type III secretory pathway protein FliH